MTREKSIEIITIFFVIPYELINTISSTPDTFLSELKEYIIRGCKLGYW